MFQKINRGNLNQIIFDEIKKKIIDNELKPGEKLDVDFLSAQLGVSRTPVTNALKALEHSGYVVVYPRSGSYVRKYSYDEIEAIFDFREALEALIAKKAIQKADKDCLRQYKESFRDILKRYDENASAAETWVDKFFALEVRFHEFLIQTCPPIIGQEVQNLIDLTKRVRKLHLKYYSARQNGPVFKKKEVRLHIDLIEALIQDDGARAEAIVRQDISDTKNEILSLYPTIENEFAVPEKRAAVKNHP